jgi:putative inorganic carbon (HCO3(-)) transporter
MTDVLAIFVAWSTVSVLWAESTPAAIDASFRYFQNLLLFLIVFTAIRTRRHAVWMATAFVAGAGTLCALGLFFTFSRGGLVALACAMLASLFVAGRWRPAIVSTMLTVALLGVGYFAFLAPQESRDRIAKVDGGTVRGVGSGNFQLTSGHYLLTKPGAVKYDYFIRYPKVAHNTYLQVLAELGFVGLGLFLAIIAFALACAWRAARRFMEAGDLDMELLTRGLILAVIGLLAADFFISAEYSKQLWLLLGLGPALLAIAETRARRQALGSF